MAKYRKKPVEPVEIEAEPYREGLEDGFEWLKVSLYKGAEQYEQLIKAWHGDVVKDDTATVQIPYINTLEGKMLIKPTDMIRITKDDKYPMRKDEFDMTYEKVEE